MSPLSPVKLSPARGFGLALCRGGCLHCHAAWYLGASGSCGCSAPIKMHLPPWVPAYRVLGWGWVTGRSGDEVHVLCNFPCVRLPSLVSLLS